MQTRTLFRASRSFVPIIALITACSGTIGEPPCGVQEDAGITPSCPSAIEVCQDLATWCTGGVYLWPRTSQDVAEYGVAPACFCMCETDAGCAGSPEPATCGVLSKSDGTDFFPDHVWYGDKAFTNGRPLVCLTSATTTAPTPATCND